MTISARVHYAALALVELAIRSTNCDSNQAPVAVREITKRHGIPGPFLVQILRTLRSAGWVQSVRGSQGGYRLLADPSELTLLDVADAVGCQENQVHTDSADTAADRLLQQTWESATEASRQELAKITVAQLASIAAKENANQDDGVMFYI